MPTDAQIFQISSLTQYATGLGSFAESTAENSTAFVNLMTEKLYELKEMQKKAQKIQQEVAAERQRLFRAYAAAAQNGNRDDVRDLLKALQVAEQKERIANRNLSLINSQVNVAHGAVITIIDKNKLFKTEITQNVEKGRMFLQKIKIHLEQYMAYSRQI